MGCPRFCSSGWRVQRISQPLGDIPCIIRCSCILHSPTSSPGLPLDSQSTPMAPSPLPLDSQSTPTGLPLLPVGFNWDSTGTQLGVHLEFTWSSLGVHLEFTWSPLGVHWKFSTFFSKSKSTYFL